MVQPNGTAWTFQYDSANANDSTSIGYGDLLKIGFPTGGSITYTYESGTTYEGDYDTGMLTTLSRLVATRTVDAGDGTGPHQWTYTWGGNPGGTLVASSTDYEIENVVTSPLGDDTVHHITGFFGGPSLYETQTRYYQGSHTSGTLLKTVNTDYSYSSNPFDMGPQVVPPTAINVVPIRVTTSLPNGLTSKVETDYDSNSFTFHDPTWGLPLNPQQPFQNSMYPGTLGTVLARRQYDSGVGAPGNLLNQTLTTYLWQNNSNYLNANLLDLPASVVVQDGAGNKVTETDTTYDESQYLTASNITTQHQAAPNSVRGNLTTVSHWLNTSSNPVVTHTNWYDTGEVYQAIDALGNATTHSYDSYYAGAYPTKTCNALSQCVSGTYDFNSGLLTSFTDQNASSQASGNTPGDAHNTWNYTYDSMFRMATAVGPLDNSLNHPETDFLYPNATTVQRCKKQNSNGGSACSSNGWIVDYAYFDGLGRTKQTRLVDPEGDDFVDTSYDALGRVSTVSNPHRSSSLPTDGTTTTQYDALGRAIKMTKQDGSVVTTQYDLTSSNSANGDCTITTDEAGKQRKSCVDGLGRLIEVDEPGPGANSGGTPGSGSITISGSLSSSTTSGTKATGWFTVSGTDTFVYACQSNPNILCNPNPRLNSKIWDTGSVSVTINGVQGSASYSQNSTDAGLASSIASGLSPSPVTYTSNGAGTINVTANVPGPNYSMSGTSATGDPTDFSGASFSVQVSGSTLTGGVYPVTTYDSGTLTVTVNGFQASASYSQNQNSTAAAMAQALTNALNASGSPVTASLSGTTITLTSKAVGANYTVSGSSTASFTASSTTLGGGTNPGGIDAPYVTLYSYDVLGNLLSVNQKGDGSQAARVRSFTYDSLSRLLTAYNPESGTISYSYDGNGNVLRKISPAPNQTGTATQTISYCYDQLNRITGKAYSAQTCSNGQLPAGTASASYIYDIPAPFGWQLENYIGRLVEENSYDSSGTLRSQNLYDYDSLGRVFVMEQGCGGGDCSDPPSSYAVYTYDLTGEVSSLHTYEGSIYDITYNYTYDTAGRATGMTSSLSDAQHPGTLASGVSYYPTGAMRQMTYGNGLTGTNVYNQRLQPCRGNLNFSGTGLQNCGDAIPAADVQDFSYGFNFGSGDNGNVASMTAVGKQSFNRSYSYDNLNRLTGQNSPADTCTGLTWSYDAWGNRLSQSGTGGTCNTMATTALANNQISGYAYDAAGNMTGDGLHTYTYDAENRIISVDGGVTARFVYDAQGRRVGKIINDGGQWKNYLYGTSGEVLSESTLSGTTYGWPAAYAYFGGQLVAEYENSTTNFVHHDHLGSTRLMTAAGPSTRIQTSGGSNTWKYYYTGVCPGTSGVVYTVSVWIKNQGTTSMKISGNIVDGPVIAPGTTQLVSFTETGNGVSCIQLGIATVNVGDGMDILAYAPTMSASGGSNMVPAANQNFSGWVAYQGAAVTVTQGQTPMVVDSMDYLPYGEQIAGSWGSTHKFTGKERDSETSLDYFGARYYANAFGRFLTPDWSAGPATVPYAHLENPQTLNLYAYVDNNPISSMDPDGHRTESMVAPTGSWGLDTMFSFSETVTEYFSADENPYFTGGTTMTAGANAGSPSTSGQQAGQNQQQNATVKACSAQMRYRDASFGKTHSWWWVSTGDKDYTISGTAAFDFINGLVLNVYVTEGTTSKSNPKDNLNNGTIAFNEPVSPNNCPGVGRMLDAARSFPNNQFAYGAPFTSNSVARYVGDAGGFHPSPPPRSTGWSAVFPGLEF